MFILGLLTRIMFKISFITAPIANATAGTNGLFKPYSQPFIVWLNATNIIAIDDNLSTIPPSGAFG